MVVHKGKTFADKHGPDVQPDESVKNEILSRIKNDEISCAVAFQIAKDLDIAPSQVGKTADLLNLKLVKCQLGLFGYKPKAKIMTPQGDAPQDMKDAIRDARINDRLPCKSLWEIAAQFGMRKMMASGVCEAMNVKIKPCQLGAF